MRGADSGKETNPRRRIRGGFALLITVLLLSLLLLALVSTATLTRIETSIGFNSRRQSQAQQNALFALNRAFGELQRHAGPDARITARADITSATIANPYWTGVWNPDGSLRTWLVTGNESLADGSTPAFAPDAIRQQQASGTATWESVSTAATPSYSFRLGEDVRAALLVGPGSTGNASGAAERYVLAPLRELLGPAPDGSGTVPLGHYGWWVGDDGVKASVALPDRLSEVNYGPYAEITAGVVPENRKRLRQQVPLTHESFRATGATGSPLFGFDPALPANSGALQNVIARPQLAFLSKAANATVLTGITDRFHDWTSVSYGVLANTLPASNVNRGLKRDLSINPPLLGPAFTAWQNYGAYMAEPLNPDASHPPFPAITSEDDVRRRYQMVFPPASPLTGDLVLSVTPILSEFIMCFGIRRDPGTGNAQVGVRTHLAIWNPYTSALLPTDLQAEITNLPTITADEVDIDLMFATRLASPLKLPFGFSTSDASWLPGRVFSWRTPSGNDPKSNPFPLLFNSNNLTDASGWTFATAIPLVGSGSLLDVQGPPTSVTVTLKTNEESPKLIGVYTGPLMSDLGDPWSLRTSGAGSWDFGFGFRLNQPTAAGGTNPWLTTDSVDPRHKSVGAGLLIAHAPSPFAGLLPNTYDAMVTTDWDGSSGKVGLLLNRSTTDLLADRHYNNDTPIFELPRSPILSLGMLQHMQVAGARPFSVGNSWGAAIQVPSDGNRTIGSWFDRFFFSGVSAIGAGPDIAAGQAFPFFHLRTFDPAHNLTLATFRAAGETDSRHLLMAGAFNVNSTSVDAWAAVLKALRPTAPDAWSVGNLDPSTGTVTSSVGVDTPIRDLTQGPSTPPGDTAAKAFAFFRFSQSAQETFQTTGPASGIDRTRFRQGFRGGSEGTGGTAGRNLTSVQIDTLAANIVANIRAKAAASGPIRSMESFVGKALPTAAPAQSLIEEAISAAGINTGLPDFCSQTLTQADILTAIGPMLQCRSDTFTIRAYGETENPVTKVVEGRAWCEATVQRIPTPVATEDVVQPAGPFGRRFQIVAFRWLSPSDI